MSTVDHTPPKTPVSPKVIAAGIAAVAVPILLAGVLAGIQWLTGDHGTQWLDQLPGPLGDIILAVAAAAAAVIGGYLKTDPLRYHPTPEPIGPAEDPQP